MIFSFFKINFKNIELLDPLNFFLLIWITQIFGYFFYLNSFGFYEKKTYIIVGLAILGFVSGSIFVKYFSKHHWAGLCFKNKYNFKELSNLDFNKVSKWFLVLYGLFSLFVTYRIAYEINAKIATESIIPTYVNIRHVIEADFFGERKFYNLFRFYHIGVVFSLFLISFYKQLTKINILLLTVFGIALSLLTTSRLVLLLFVIGLIAIFYMYKKISNKLALLGLFGFVVLFLLIALVAKKGLGNMEGLAIIKWNLQVYLFSPLAAFNYYVKTGISNTHDIILIPTAFKKILNHFGANFQYETIRPFVDVPVRTNVYTYLYPLYHDGGVLLILVANFIISGIHQLIYILAKKNPNPLSIYLFAISLYPLAITFFEDGYFSSPGFLFIQLTPLILAMAVYFFSKPSGQLKASV